MKQKQLCSHKFPVGIGCGFCNHEEIFDVVCVVDVTDKNSKLKIVAKEQE